MIEDPTPEELDALLQDRQAVVMEFHADWCGPCKAYGPTFQRASRALRRSAGDDVAFVRVDVDRNHEVAGRFRVRSVPTTVVATAPTGFLARRRGHREVLRFAGARGYQPLLRSLADALDVDI